MAHHDLYVREHALLAAVVVHHLEAEGDGLQVQRVLHHLLVLLQGWVGSSGERGDGRGGIEEGRKRDGGVRGKEWRGIGERMGKWYRDNWKH